MDSMTPSVREFLVEDYVGSVCAELDEIEVRERLYVLAEREGMRLDSILCPDCTDPGLCAAEGECVGGGTPE